MSCSLRRLGETARVRVADELSCVGISAGCPPGGVVLDPFSGAGTTGLAAVQLGRRFVGIDIAAGFHDEALARLAPYLPTGSGGPDR